MVRHSLTEHDGWPQDDGRFNPAASRRVEHQGIGRRLRLLVEASWRHRRFFKNDAVSMPAVDADAAQLDPPPDPSLGCAEQRARAVDVDGAQSRGFAHFRGAVVQHVQPIREVQQASVWSGEVAVNWSGSVRSVRLRRTREASDDIA